MAAKGFQKRRRRMSDAKRLRHRTILALYRKGITSDDQILKYLEDNQMGISIYTLLADKKELAEALDNAWQEELESFRMVAVAQFDDISLQLEQIAQAARDKDTDASNSNAVRALAQRRDTVIAKLKAAGVWVEKNENQNLNYNYNREAPASYEDVEAVSDALRRLGTRAPLGLPPPKPTLEEASEGE